MAQLALGAVGAVVGAYFGGPAGASLGWGIGSALGGALFPPKGPHTEGPRLTDLKQQLSTYGAPKPMLWGRISASGCVIWTADVLEVSTTTETGKGEPSTSSTTFSYFWSGAILIAKGPRDGTGYHSLLRIWCNGQCQYDVRDPTNVAAMTASANFAVYFTWYPGDYTQEPDPTMEAELGVGNVPGYRGRSYIVFNDLPLVLFNNFPPGALNWEFEIQRQGPTDAGIKLLLDGFISDGIHMYPVVDGLMRIRHLASSTTVSIVASDGTFIGYEDESEEEADWGEMYAEGPGDQTYGTMLLYDGTTVRATNQNLGPLSDPTNLLYAEVGGAGGSQVDAKPLFPDQTQYLQDVIPCADRRHILVLTGAPGISPNSDTWWMLLWNGTGWEIESTGVVIDSPGEYLAGTSSQGSLFFSGIVESNLRYMWTLDGIAGPSVRVWWINDDDEFVKLFDYTKSPTDPISNVSTYMWAENGLAWTVSGGYYNLWTRIDTFGDSNQLLSEVVSDICVEATLSTSQINVTELTDTVDGFRITPVGAGRAFLIPLERGYFFDSVETGGKIKFVKRGQSSVVTIPQDDLGAYSDSSATEELVVNERQEEDALPGELNVAYFVKDADYQAGVQTAQREATVTEQPTNIELPLVLTDLKAKEVGEVLLYDSWLGRTRRSFKTSLKYSYLEPTDVVTLELDDATYVVRIIAMRRNGGILEFDSVDEESAIYEPNSAAGAIIDQNPGAGSTLVGPTMVALMDLPALRSTDSDAGFYVGAVGYYDDWAGFQLFVSNDSGATYLPLTATSTAATMGTVAAALPTYAGGNFFDDANQITVSLRHGSLASTTDAGIYAEGNAFALGNETKGYEIIQFKTATLVSGMTYTLSQLLRGRKGTERLMSTHVANEKFVMLETAKLLRVGGEVASLNVAKLYKPVTFMRTVAETTALTFTNTGAALKPYSPVHVRALRTAATGDITIYWIRRGRLNNEWTNGIEVPLSETSESYEIDIYEAGVLQRTLTSSVQSVAYTLAQQATDFGSPMPASLDLKIRQQSAEVGDGFEYSGTVLVIG